MPPPPGDDPTLTEAELALVLRGDRPAMRSFVDRFGPTLRGRVRAVRMRWFNPLVEEEDLLQIVFTALFNNRAHALRQWDPLKGRTLANFLRVFAGHRAVEALRRRSLETPAEPETLIVISDRAVPGRDDGLDWLAGAVDQVLEKCGEIDRRFFGRFIAGDTMEELAAEFGLSLSAVYQRISRFRKRIIELGGPEAARQVALWG